MTTDIVSAFESAWRALGGPPLTAEYVFAPPRKFRFDFVHLPSAVAIECEGGIWHGTSRHTHPTGFRNDLLKYNLATSMGWRVFRLSIDMIVNDPVGNLAPIIAAMREGKA